jgi:hypothetical protein
MKHLMPRPHPRDFSQAATLEVNVSKPVVSRKVPTGGRKTSGTSAKLKSSKWYQGAARSIGITKETSLESGDDIFE